VLGRVGNNEVAAIAVDPDALDRFYREHVDAVERFVARRVGDPYAVADLTADVFLAAIEAAGSYSGRRSSLPDDVTLVITTQTLGPAPDGSGHTGSALSIRYAQGAVGPCRVVDAQP